MGGKERGRCEPLLRRPGSGCSINRLLRVPSWPSLAASQVESQDSAASSSLYKIILSILRVPLS